MFRVIGPAVEQADYKPITVRNPEEDFGAIFGSAVTARWAARFKATPSMLELAAKHRVPLQSAAKHFTFQYELPRWPLQKRKAKTTNAYTRKQLPGSVRAMHLWLPSAAAPPGPNSKA